MPDNRRWRRNILLLYGHAVASGSTAFMAPILVLYWREHGVSITGSSILEVAFAVILAAFSLPNGIAADRHGRVRVIRRGSLLLLSGLVLYFLAEGFWGFLCAELALALGFASFSGAPQTVLTDSVRLSGGNDVQAGRAIGRVKSLLFLTGMSGAILGGWLAEINSRLPLGAAAFGGMIGAAIAFGLREPPIEGSECRNQIALRSLPQLVRENGRLKELLLISATFAGLLHAGQVLFAPQFAACGLSPFAIGVLMAAMNLVGVICTRYLPDIRLRRGERFLSVVSFGCVASAYLMLGCLVSPLGALFVLALPVARAFAEVVLVIEIEAAVQKEIRSTVLGLRSTLDWIGRCLVLFSSGVTAETIGARPTFLAVSLIALTLGVRALRAIPIEERA